MPAAPAQSRGRAVPGPDTGAERGLSAGECGAGRDAPHQLRGALGCAGADRGPLWAEGWLPVLG